MKYFLFFILLPLPFTFLSCSGDDDWKEVTPPREYETIVGNTYVFYKLGVPFTYHFYTFNEDGTIDVEIRKKDLDGELESKSVGYYEYNHPIIKLKVQSIRGCDNCFNEFEAEVFDTRRKFYIRTWIGDLWDFHVYDDHYMDYNKPFS